MLLATVGGFEMSFSMNLYYSGENGNAKAFAEEMISSGIVEKIKQIDGCLRYEYFTSFEHPETILLIDSWREQNISQALSILRLFFSLTAGESREHWMNTIHLL